MLDSTRYRSDESAARDAAADRSLAEDVKALVSDGRLLAEAEIDYQKKRAAYGASAGKGVAASYVVAAIFGFFALMAITVGLILALGQIITYWGSTAVVAGALLLIAWIFAARGKARLARMKAVLADEEGEDL